MGLGLNEKLFNPVGSLYFNWVEIQDYQNEYLINYLSENLHNKLEVITFDYRPNENNERASLSFHLTAGEKKDIKDACTNAYNMQSMLKLKEAIQ